MQHMLVCIKKYCSSGQGEPRDSSWSLREVACSQSKPRAAACSREQATCLPSDPAAPIPTWARPTAVGFVRRNHDEGAKAGERSSKSRSALARSRRPSAGSWLYKAQTCDLGSLPWQTVTEASEQTGERKPCTASRNRDRSEAVYSVTQRVKRKVLMQKYIKHQGEIVEKLAKVRSGCFQRAAKVVSSHGTAGCVARTDHTNFFLKRDLVPAIYCINPEITLLHTHKEHNHEKQKGLGREGPRHSECHFCNSPSPFRGYFYFLTCHPED